MSVSSAVEQARDLESVVQLWRKIGHTAGSIKVYTTYVRLMLREARCVDYQSLCADRIVQVALAYAQRRNIGVLQARRMWLASFRAFAWALQRLGKPVGSVDFINKSRTKLEPIVQAFMQYGTQLGWADGTLRLRVRHLQCLRGYLTRHHRPWPIPPLRDLDRFLQLSAKRWTRTTVAAAAGTFRCWLRFLFVTGRSEHDLSASVALPPSIAYPRPARAVPWSTVRQLRHGIDPSTPIGRRDEAQYLLFCAYGLSSAEVTHLKLEDIDWHASILHIRRVKNGSTVDVPLLPVVAKVIAAYLRRARPSKRQQTCFHSTYNSFWCTDSCDGRATSHMLGRTRQR